MGATAAATFGGVRGRPRAAASCRARDPRPTADAVILLWMAGGMAQTETFDPKRYTPFAPGVPIERVLSTFPPIDTAVDKSSSPRVSSGSRSHGPRHADPHVPPRRTWASSCTRVTSITGTPATSRRSRWPCRIIGAVISRTLGPQNPTMPAFIAIGQNLEIGARKRGHQGFPHRRLSGHRVRPLPDRESARRGSQRPAAQRSSASTRFTHPAAIVSRSWSRSEPVGAVCERFSARVPAALARFR